MPKRTPGVLFRSVILGLLATSCGGADSPAPAEEANILDERPNILLIVADDLGYNDIGAFGGEIDTPNLDALAASGLTLTTFYVLPTCSPTRSVLLTGSDNHTAGMGAMAEVLTSNQIGAPGYEGYLNERVVTVASLLRDADYHTYMAGKWHLGHEPEQGPKARGFERVFTMLDGGGSHWNDRRGVTPDSAAMRYRDEGVPVDSLPADFFSSEFYTDRMIEYIDANRDDGRPFFAYVAYTAPHDPLHAPDAWLEKYRGRYDAGYDELRRQRLERMTVMGLLPESTQAYPRLPTVPAWDELSQEDQAIEAREMEAYAGMVDNLDHHIGRILEHLRQIGEYDNTLILFFSDNGANGLEGRNYPNQTDAYMESFNNSVENIGRPGSFAAQGPAWAQVSMTPFRLFKASAAEGGIRAPFIAAGPGISAGGRSDSLAHVKDIAPTLLEVAGVEHPNSYEGRDIAPMIGSSMRPLLNNSASTVHDTDASFGWELHGQEALRTGQWKALKLQPPFGAGEWELFDLSTDPGETKDLSGQEAERLQAMIATHQRYAEEVGVVPPDLDELLRSMGIQPPQP